MLRFADGRALYFSGDTNVFTDMQLIEQLYHPELAFLPIGDLYTMSPREAEGRVRMLKAKKIIPMHFGTFPQLTGTPQQLARLISGPSGNSGVAARAWQAGGVVNGGQALSLYRTEGVVNLRHTTS